jgi:hypothetical protein
MFGPIHPSYITYNAIDMFDQTSSIPHHLHTSTTYIAAPMAIGAQTIHLPYGADPLLEPPPTLNEPHLSIQDRAAFCPITSYFHRFFGHFKPVVPGLDLVQVPDFISRDDLKGDEYDYQGIDWTKRNVRSHILMSTLAAARQRLAISCIYICKKQEIFKLTL